MVKKSRSHCQKECSEYLTADVDRAQALELERFLLKPEDLFNGSFDPGLSLEQYTAFMDTPVGLSLGLLLVGVVLSTEASLWITGGEIDNWLVSKSTVGKTVIILILFPQIFQLETKPSKYQHHPLPVLLSVPPIPGQTLEMTTHGAPQNQEGQLSKATGSSVNTQNALPAFLQGSDNKKSFQSQPPNRLQTPYAQQSTSSAFNTLHPSFLEFCVNQGENYIGLEEIHLKSITHDGMLFDRLKQAYNQLRGFRKVYFLLKPVDFQYIKVNKQYKSISTSLTVA